jgi:hypothetical protein
MFRIVICALLIVAGNLLWRRARAGKRGALFSSSEGSSLLIIICGFIVLVGVVGLFMSMSWLKALGLFILMVVISGLIQE